MKTSVIEVRDMLSVLSVSGVEERIGKVPGVESVTLNYAAGSATVRYDETRLEIADIKSAVRQSGFESGNAPDDETATPAGTAQQGKGASVVAPPIPGTPSQVSSAAASVPTPAAPKPLSDSAATAAAPATAAPAVDEKHDKGAPGTH